MLSRKEILEDLALKLGELKDLTSMSKNVGGGGGSFVPSSNFTTSVDTFIVRDDDDSPFGGPSIGSIPTTRKIKQMEMSAMERQGLAQIEENKVEEEKMLDIISDLGSDLKEIALGLNEEANKQNYMLDNVGDKMAKVSDKMETTAKSMKKTRNDANRPGDKFCMDIICLILLLGVLTVIYNMVKKYTAATS